MGCTADVASLNFPMGMSKCRRLTVPATSIPGQKNVNLTCEPGTNVSMTMNAATVSGDNSTIALSDNGDGSTATGWGSAGKKTSQWRILCVDERRPDGTDLYSKRSDTSTWSAGTDADGTTPFSGDTGTGSTYTDATNPGGASANETLTFRANYHKIGKPLPRYRQCHRDDHPAI